MITTRSSLCVLDDSFKIYSKYTGLNITEAMQMSYYLYIINETMGTVRQQHVLDGDYVQEAPLNVDKGKAFSVVNLNQLLNQKFEMIYILQATAGCCGRIMRSRTSERLAWMSSLCYLTTMPIPHLNLISMVGMGQKHEYLIWRKGVNGLFTALDVDGALYTWCFSNGKLLYKIRQRNEQAGSRRNLKGYTVYRTNKDDNAYCRDLFENSDGSYQLLVSKWSLDMAETRKMQPSQEILDELQRQEEEDLHQKDRHGLPEDLFKKYVPQK